MVEPVSMLSVERMGRALRQRLIVADPPTPRAESAPAAADAGWRPEASRQGRGDLSRLLDAAQLVESW